MRKVRDLSGRRVIAAGVVGLLMGATACRDAEDGAEPRFAEAVIDTIGGVAHVSNPAPSEILELEPVLTLGSMGGIGEAAPDEFASIRSVVADADGNVYVADSEVNELKVFDATGDFLRMLGRAGEGPGEFGRVYSLGWLGDTLAVLDPGNARIQLMSRQGEPLGTFRWYPLTGSPEAVRLFSGGPEEMYARAIVEHGRSGTAHLIRYTHGAADTLAIELPEREDVRRSDIFCEGPRMITFLRVPFAPHLLYLPAPDMHAVLAWSDRYRVDFVDARGDTVRTIEREHTPIPITDAAWDSALVAEEWAQFQERTNGMDCEGEMWRPERRPAITALFFDHEGRLVVEATSPEGPVLDFYDGDGRLRLSVHAPVRGDRAIPYFRDDRMYLPVADSLGIPSVRVWRLSERALDDDEAGG